MRKIASYPIGRRRRNLMTGRGRMPPVGSEEYWSVKTQLLQRAEWRIDLPMVRRTAPHVKSADAGFVDRAGAGGQDRRLHADPTEHQHLKHRLFQRTSENNRLRGQVADLAAREAELRSQLSRLAESLYAVQNPPVPEPRRAARSLRGVAKSFFRRGRLRLSAAQATRNGLRSAALFFQQFVHGDIAVIEREIQASGIFLSDWYVDRYPEVSERRENPIRHYLLSGASKGYDPNPLFDSDWYLSEHPNLAADGLNPLLHYLRSGAAKRHDPHPLFDSEWYLERNPDVAAAGVNPLAHYLLFGSAEGRDPHPLFNSSWYLAQRPDLADRDESLLAHYLRTGAAQGLDPHPLFDSDWYWSQQPEVDEPHENPLVHFLRGGAAEGRDPHPLFDSSWYLTSSPDVGRIGLNPLAHYVRWGAAEGRDAHPLFDPHWYLDHNPDVRGYPGSPLEHYVVHGGAERREPNPYFDSAFYLEQLGLRQEVSAPHATERAPRDAGSAAVARAADCAREDVQNPLIHFLQHGLSNLVPPNDSILQLRLDALSKRRDVDPACVPRSTDLAPLDALPLPPKLVTFLRFAYDEGVVNQVRVCYHFLNFHEGIRVEEATLEAHLEVRQIIREVAALANQKGSVQPRAPDATVIVPVYEQLVHTLSCLRAVLTWPTRCTFEIIVADDASNDATARAVQEIGGIVRLHRAEKNIGFVRNCNAAARAARGSILVFLNNDTLPLPGWLDELVDCLRAEPKRGLAGSKLLNRDGTLQEAGGIIWEDGSAWNFGRGNDPAAPSYNYVKEADYVSGAAIAVSAELWRSLGGFDEAYAPAYYEDVDFAFRVRAAGFRTVYQPFSNVLHLEGASHGRELSKGIKAYQQVNKETFYQRWQEVLAIDHFLPEDLDGRAPDRSRRRPRLLVVDHYVPEPDRDSGSRAIFDYLTLFVSAGFRVTFWPDDLRFDRRYTPPLQRLGIEVIYHLDRPPRFDDWLAANAGILDYAIVSRPYVAEKFLDKLRLSSAAKIIYFGVDIHFQRYQRQYAATGSQLSEYEMMRFERAERDIWSKSDVICYYSNEETDFIRSQYPEKAARTVPIFFFSRDRLNETRERIARHGISRSKQVIFVAGFRHPPNVDAMLWLASAIWPDVVAAVPDARLCVVGSSPPPEISGLASASILVTGHVSDEVLALLYSSSSACVVPLRFGAGVKGKVLEAISFGAPVVTTPTGVQGIPNATAFLAVCDGAREISKALIQILHDPDSQRDRILKGLDYLGDEVSETSALRIMSADVPELLGAAAAGR